MGEKTGFLFALAIVVMCMLPAGIDFFTLNVTTSQFLNTTTEMQQLINEEGGITDRVKYVVNSSSINYSFTDETGKKVDGIQDVGDVIYIDYEYEWDGLYSNESLKTTNTVRIARR